MYIVVRSDLPPGLQIAQSIHAFREFCELYPQIESEWYTKSNYIVVLSANNIEHLTSLIDQCKDLDVKVAIFQEPDIDNQITAIAIEPGDTSKKIVRRLPLALK